MEDGTTFRLKTLHKDESGAEVRAQQIVLLNHEVGGDLGDGLGGLSVRVLGDHDVLVLAHAGLHALELEVHALGHPGDAAHVPFELLAQLVGYVPREDLAVRADRPVTAGLCLDGDLLVIVVGRVFGKFVAGAWKERSCNCVTVATCGNN